MAFYVIKSHKGGRGELNHLIYLEVERGQIPKLLGMFHLPCHNSHAGPDMRAKVVLEAVRGVVHVFEYQAVHPGLQVDLRLLPHLVKDLRHPHGGGRRAYSKIQKIGRAWKKIN